MAYDADGFLAAYDAVLSRWSVPVEMLELVSEFGTTHVNACGPAGAQPLVLLNGGGTTAAVWFANVAGLSRVRRLYAVDRIGEPGGSQAGERPISSPADLLDWLDGVLDGLGLPQADLCGHSYGGSIALSYALRAPGRVAKLVLLDPTGCLAGFSASYLLHAAPVLARPNAARAAKFLAWETGGVGIDPAWLELYKLGAEFPAARPVTLKRPDSSELATCRVLTLVLLAGASRAHDLRRVEAGARLLPRASVQTLPGVSHHGMPFIGAAEINRAVAGFLCQP
ncbi:MAG TPA: alpha/beta fold hydrolase [Streptosporangiaceae bacterium]|nr:alpha/beta fold hydrolase [Streptosporangiaceae bacterium]